MRTVGFLHNLTLKLNDRIFLIKIFLAVDELVEYVKKIDQDDDLYNSYIQEPLFSDNTISNQFQPASVLEFFQNTILA